MLSMHIGFRRIALILIVVSALAVACGGDSEDGDSGIAIDEPIGAPPDSVDPAVPAAAQSNDPSVVKNAVVEVEVVEDELTSAAQMVVDIATDGQTGGFLVSSIVDTDDGNGFGNVIVKVPAVKFEHVVGELGSIGEVTRQQLEGQDLTPQFLAAVAQERRTRARIAALLSRLDETEEPAVTFRLREDLRSARAELRSLNQNENDIEAQSSYATINVHLTATPLPAPPEKPAFERALETAKSLTVAIASGAILAAGVVIPVGVLVFVVYIALASIVRRLRPRWEG